MPVLLKRAGGEWRCMVAGCEMRECVMVEVDVGRENYVMWECGEFWWKCCRWCVGPCARGMM